jgi:site-specific recombinase XerD
VRDNQPLNSKQAYKTYAKQFKAYADHFGQISVPAVPNTVANFLRHLHEDNDLSANTICRVARSAVADLHRFRPETPTDQILVEETCKVLVFKAKKIKPKKIPIRSNILLKLLSTLDLSTLQDLTTATMLVLSYKGFLRSDECTKLKADDLWIEEVTSNGIATTALFVFVEKSKTDQTRIGHTIVLGMDNLNPWKCPVRHFRAFSKKRSDAEFFFHNASTLKKLPAKGVNSALKKACKVAGLDPKLYSSHGLRAGGATEAAAKGIRTRQIKKHGNWKSSAVYLYIHDDVETQLQVSLAI